MYEIAAVSRDHLVAACSFSQGEYDDCTELLELRHGVWSRSAVEGAPRSLASMNHGLQRIPVILVEPYRAILFPALSRTETIADLPRDSQGRMIGGYLNRIRQIGSKMYVCGYGGQLYARDTAGLWTILDETLLVPFRPYVGAKTFLNLNGPNENEIYVAHDEGLSFWNGKSLRKIEGSGENITGIFVESPLSVWICGWHGLVMRGNHIDGFRTIVKDPKDQMFLSLCVYEDAVYLGSVNGFDRLRNGRIDPTGPRPRSERRLSISRVETVDGIMWAVGEGDVLRLEGSTWVEVPFDPPWRDAPPLYPE